MQDFTKRARGIVDRWPSGGCVVGVLPDRSDPRWSGRAVLGLIEAARGSREPVVVIDLAPGATDLDARFEVGAGPGLAELEAGEVELWQIARRDDTHGVVYLSRGKRDAEASLADSASCTGLAEDVREKGGLLLVVVDRSGAEDLTSAGYADGFVRIGARGEAAPPDRGRDRNAERADGSGEGDPGPPAGRSDSVRLPSRPEPPGSRDAPDDPPLVLTPEMRASGPSRAWRRGGLVALMVLITAGLGVYGAMDGSVQDALAGASGLFPDSGDRAEETAPVGADRVDPAPAESGLSASPSSRLPPADTPADEPTPGDDALDTAAVSAPERPAAPAAEERAGVAPDDGSPNDGRDASEPPTGSEPADAGAGLPRATVESSGPPVFRAVADSLARSVNGYARALEGFREGAIGCAGLGAALERADRLFERLWLHRMSLRPRLDSAANATFAERARQIEAVQRSFAATDCSR